MRQFRCFPDGNLYAIQELERNLNFIYLFQIAFESPEDREHIRKRGMGQLNGNEVSKKSLEMGNQYRQAIESAYIPDVSIRWLDEELGYGLFLEENLEAGAFAGEYTGIVRKNDRNYFEPMNHYCYSYPLLDEIGRNLVTDGTQGNLTRFINHSFCPNLYPFHVFLDGFFHLIFLTIHPLGKGTQLTYDYGQNYWNIRGKPLAL